MRECSGDEARVRGVCGVCVYVLDYSGALERRSIRIRPCSNLSVNMVCSAILALNAFSERISNLFG